MLLGTSRRVAAKVQIMQGEGGLHHPGLMGDLTGPVICTVTPRSAQINSVVWSSTIFGGGG